MIPGAIVFQRYLPGGQSCLFSYCKIDKGDRNKGTVYTTSGRKVASNEFGNSASILNFSTWPDKLASITSVRGEANSHIICRQHPHGGVGVPVSATTTTLRISRTPS